jgi:HAMP domain-containing protein
MRIKYGVNIEGRNRALDQVRFEAVEKGYLTGDMLAKLDDEKGYYNPALKEQILARYESEILNKRIVPEHPSEAYIKTQALLKRNRAYLEKQVYAQDIAKSLRQSAAVEQKHEADQFLIKDHIAQVTEKKDAEFAKTKKTLKEKLLGYLSDIPLIQRKDSRPAFAKQLRNIQTTHAEAIQDVHEGNAAVSERRQETHANMQQEILREIESRMWQLSDARADFDAQKSIDVPTDAEKQQARSEEIEAVEQAINALLLSYKVEGYDEGATHRAMAELETKIQKHIATIPYVDEKGEPRAEEIQAFKAQHSVVASTAV